jgi:hypothetical protein
MPELVVYPAALRRPLLDRGHAPVALLRVVFTRSPLELGEGKLAIPSVKLDDHACARHELVHHARIADLLAQCQRSEADKAHA